MNIPLEARPFTSMPAAVSTEALTRVAIACTMAVLVAAPCRAEAQEYHGKLTVGAYAADDQVTTDFNVRMEYDWHRWFVKLARDQHVNFSPATMWRAGGGLRF